MAGELDALVALIPFAADLGISLEEAAADRVVAVLAWAPRLCTGGGVLHGGALMALADSAGALVAYLGLPDGAWTATITSTTQLFRPVSAGEVRAVAVPLHRGRSTVTVQTTMTDGLARSWRRRRRFRLSALPRSAAAQRDALFVGLTRRVPLDCHSTAVRSDAPA